jgi:predicted Zn-dependent protease
VIAARAVVVALAVAAVAWLGAALGAARAREELVHLAFDTERPTAADYRRAAELAEDARRATAGERIPQVVATLHLKGGDDAGAVRILLPAVRREPLNAEAWALLARAAERVDPGLAARARQRVRALVPPVPPP